MLRMKMNFIVFISSLILVQAVVHNDEVVISDVRNHVEVLYENNGTPDALLVDYVTNLLYFRNDGATIKILDLNTGEFRKMDGVTDASAITVDQETQNVYIGAVDGIYKYNPNTLTDNLELIGATGVNVWCIYFNGAIYYNAQNSNTVYNLTDGESTKIVDLDVDHTDVIRKRLFVDNEDTIYFSFDSVLYRQKVGAKAVVLYTGKDVKAVNKDRNGNVYFSTSGGIYEVLKESNTVRKVISIDDCHSFTFDAENNIIFSDNANIYRLKPDVEISEMKTKMDDLDNKIDDLEKKMNTKFDNLEKKMDKLVEMLQPLLVRTHSYPRAVHLDIKNLPIKKKTITTKISP